MSSVSIYLNEVVAKKQLERDDFSYVYKCYVQCKRTQRHRSHYTITRATSLTNWFISNVIFTQQASKRSFAFTFVIIQCKAVFRLCESEHESENVLRCLSLITGRSEVVAKVIFLHLFVILFTGGGRCIPACIVGGIPACLAAGLQGGVYPSMHCRRYPSMPCSRSPRGCMPACIAGGIPACPYPGPHPRGKWRGIRSRPTPKGEMEGDQVQAHTQGWNMRDQVQAHNQGGNGGGSSPGPHPRGKLRGIRSRSTPKGEIEGDQVQAHTQGWNGGGSGPGPQQRGKWRGIKSRPTPKGEMEGDQVQVHTQGGNWEGSDPGPPPPPRSRLRHTVNERPARILLECILVLWYFLLVPWSFSLSLPTGVNRP